MSSLGNSWFFGLCALLAACGEGTLASLSVRLYTTPAPAAGACPAMDEDVPVLAGLSGSTDLRVTWRDATSKAVLCDAVVPLGDTSQIVGVPRAAGVRMVDLQVEAYDAGHVLTGSGEALSVDLDAAAPVKVLLAPSQAFACAPRPLAAARAFHAAVALPNGEVLVTGGLVPDTMDEGVRAFDLTVADAATGNVTGGFYATTRVELYNPQTGAWVSLSAGNLVPRAFHEAYLLASEPGQPYRIALVGGLTVAGDASMNPVADGVRARAIREPLRLVPAPGSAPAPAEILVGSSRVDLQACKLEYSIVSPK